MQTVPKAALGLVLAALALSATPVGAQRLIPADSPPTAAPAPPYPVFADLVIASPVIVDAVVHGYSRIKGAETAGLPEGYARLYVEADVQALIRGPGALPPRVGYVLDVPLDARGQLPRLHKLRVLLFARPVAGAPDQLQLVRVDAQRDWSPAADALVRQITKDVLAPDAPPEITGISRAFHMPGVLPGEGETQIFLNTASHQPVSLSVTRKPDAAPSWAVALSEVVDQAQPPPQRDTLLWYRLACFLPRDLPPESLADAAPEDAATAREDYQFVINALGPCQR
jgi:hypothetical protein